MPAKEFVAFTRLDASDVNAYLANRPLQNAIINGAFDIWQRGTTFTSPANGAYTADRWSAVFCSAVSRSTDVPEGFQYSAEFSGSASAANLNHRIEASNSIPLANQTVTVSLWAKSTDGSTELALEVYTPTAVDNFTSLTSGPTATFSATPSSGWTQYSATFTAPATATNGLQIRIVRASGTTTTRITGVQLEAGTVANDFRRNANSLQGELAACQRYYQQLNYIDGQRISVIQAFSATACSGKLKDISPMRTAPTASVSAGNHFKVLTANAGAFLASSAISLSTSDSSVETFSLTVASGLVAGNATEVFGANAACQIRLSAEL
jgi:hypothetical protein